MGLRLGDFAPLTSNGDHFFVALFGIRKLKLLAIDSALGEFANEVFVSELLFNVELGDASGTGKERNSIFYFL